MKVPAALFSLLAVAATGLGASTEERDIIAKPLVESNKLRRSILRSNLLAKATVLEDFAYNTVERNRVVGSPGHASTIQWLKETIEQYPDYYTLELQGFNITTGVSGAFTVNDEVLEVFATNLAPAGDVQGQLVSIPNLGCDAADFPADLTGKIVIVFRGNCQAGVKVGFAGARGAVGAIVYNNGVGNLRGYSLQRLTTPEGPYVPTGGISQADGLALVARLQAGEEIIAHLTTTTSVITTYNVIAETIEGDHDNVIHVGAHSDSVVQGPGINDNGSGSIAVLETAIQLTAFSVNNAVRFSWWSAEEGGLIGSTYYVSQLSQEEKDKIRLLLNFDMIASPNYRLAVYDGDGSSYNISGPPGSAEAEAEIRRYFVEEAKQNVTAAPFNGRSDYGPFLAAGIAASGISAGSDGIKTEEEQAWFGGQAGIAYDPNYHSAGDDLTNLDLGAWIETTKGVAHATAFFARSFESLPPKKTVRREEGRFQISKTATGELKGI